MLLTGACAYVANYHVGTLTHMLLINSASPTSAMALQRSRSGIMGRKSEHAALFIQKIATLCAVLALLDILFSVVVGLLVVCDALRWQRDHALLRAFVQMCTSLGVACAVLCFVIAGLDPAIQLVRGVT